ncbi:hypothetical protein N7457_002626 [Penicillium paradoxum]|uniref:uncharacterized protein n=1 Tax=Penicillium paradoxum TaxID=176176 RepID=UPI002546AACD|nr:uncharacterized protein N7457_002626 [Penicillium paradoxum]KAJ5787636.1 hypothetical protein N7457_002626 [Penicillium paradoxum]
MPLDLRSSKQALKSVLYHVYTMWLFVFSDLKTIVVPSTIFGIANTWSASKYDLHVPGALMFPHNVSDMAELIGRALILLSWLIMNFLPFAINNQRGERAVAEDRLNKPWRPFPCGRISHQSGTRLMVALYVLAPIYSLVFTGGLRHALALIWLGVWYNNWGGADKNPFVRNTINALGYTCFTSGAMEVASGGSSLPLSPFGLLGQWHLVLIGVILSTVHLQDMSDQAGDAGRGRCTAPLVWSDNTARWTIFVPMVFWGLCCPILWDVPWGWFIASTALAWLVAARTLFVRDVGGDKRTFQLWNCWIVVIYMLPLFSRTCMRGFS